MRDPKRFMLISTFQSLLRDFMAKKNMQPFPKCIDAQCLKDYGLSIRIKVINGIGFPVVVGLVSSYEHTLD